MNKVISKVIFNNDVCESVYYPSNIPGGEEIQINLIKQFNHLQIEERNSVMIAIHHCELFIKKLGYNVFATSWDNNSDEVVLSCFLKE